VEEREGGKGKIPWKRRRSNKRERDAREWIEQRERRRTEEEGKRNFLRTYAQI
jgi:hypothetical protein